MRERCSVSVAAARQPGRKRRPQGDAQPEPETELSRRARRDATGECDAEDLARHTATTTISGRFLKPPPPKLK